jgi:hypothetical protein
MRGTGNGSHALRRMHQLSLSTLSSLYHLTHYHYFLHRNVFYKCTERHKIENACEYPRMIAHTLAGGWHGCVLPCASLRPRDQRLEHGGAHTHPVLTLCLPCAYPMLTLCLPYAFPMLTLCLPYAYPMLTLFLLPSSCPILKLLLLYRWRPWRISAPCLQPLCWAGTSTVTSTTQTQTKTFYFTACFTVLAKRFAQRPKHLDVHISTSTHAHLHIYTLKTHSGGR